MRPVPGAQQAHQAERALQGMLEVVVERVDGLVAVVAPGEALPGPLEGARDTGALAVREEFPVNRLDFFFEDRKSVV